MIKVSIALYSVIQTLKNNKKPNPKVLYYSALWGFSFTLKLMTRFNKSEVTIMSLIDNTNFICFYILKEVEVMT